MPVVLPKAFAPTPASVPLLIWALSPKFPLQGTHGEQEIFASSLFILASITDGLDGYLARRRGQITTLGMLLDPLADKLMVTAAYILLVAYNPQVMKPWIIGPTANCPADPPSMPKHWVKPTAVAR